MNIVFFRLLDGGFFFILFWHKALTKRKLRTKTISHDFFMHIFTQVEGNSYSVDYFHF